MPERRFRTFSWFAVLPVVPSIVLCIVAVSQIHLVDAHGLSPWKGGGFGMFSTNDSETRQIRIIVEEPSGRREAPVPPALRIKAGKATIYPTERWLEELAREAAALEIAAGTRVAAVGVEVLRFDYDPESMAPRAVVVRKSEVRVSPREQQR